MPTSAKSARERADSFVRDAVEFRLGPLVTEASHPRSTGLSQVARRDAAAGLGVLFDVDRDVVQAYDRWSRSGQPEALRALVLQALEAGGRIFFTGCGALLALDLRHRHRERERVERLHDQRVRRRGPEAGPDLLRHQQRQLDAAAVGHGQLEFPVRQPADATHVLAELGRHERAVQRPLSIDWNAFITGFPGALGTPFAGSETVYAQGWFREPAAPKTTNLSNGLQFSVCP